MVDNGLISLAIIGLGAMGRGLFYQSTITPNIRCRILADQDIKKCLDLVQNQPYQIVTTTLEAEQADPNKILITQNGSLAAQFSRIQVVIEATNSIEAGLGFCETALSHQKHLFMMNSEVDLQFGPYLMKLAHQHNVLYSSADGDQHGVLKHLIDEITSQGFQLVLAGNIKGFLDREANPTSIIAEADKRHLGYKMAASYTDGTKLNIEMALLANACSLDILQPGMLGPRMTHVSQALDYFKYDKPCVDYILGAEPGGGVFVVGFQDNPYQRRMLAYYKMGEGPYYLFYRPYHLCHIESIANLLTCLRQQQPLLQPVFGHKTNVYAYAKKALAAGQILDGVGGYTCYGMIETCANNSGLPICLAEGPILTADVAQGQKITLDKIAGLNMDLANKQ